MCAAKAAIGGESGKMVTIVRERDTPYQASYGLPALDEIAEKVKGFPRAWIDESGSMIFNNFLRYISPLIQREVEVRHKGWPRICPSAWRREIFQKNFLQPS
ncbi:MAG: hypothetical protein LBD72_02360 [Puniceicoccales bacterium]|nr:hypothetical protein [Puniceicoccales bacterium]